MTLSEKDKNQTEKKKKSPFLWLEEHMEGAEVDFAKKLKKAFTALDNNNYAQAIGLFRELLLHEGISELFRGRILAGLALSEYRIEGFTDKIREDFFLAAVTHSDTLERLLAYYSKKFKDSTLEAIVKKYVRERASQDIF